MPIYHYACPKCHVLRKTFKKGPKCDKCAIDMVRESSGPSLDIKETLDNGIMARRVERLKDIEEIMAQRNRDDVKRKIGND